FPNHTRDQLGYSPGAMGDLPRYRPMWHFCHTVHHFSMHKKCAQLWQTVSDGLKPQISADSFKRWFSTVELLEAKDKSITLTAPNNIYQLWIECNYMPALQNAITVTFGGPRLVKFSGPSTASTQTSAEDSAKIKE